MWYHEPSILVSGFLKNEERDDRSHEEVQQAKLHHRHPVNYGLFAEPYDDEGQ